MQRDTSPHWCQGSQASCATACSRVRPHTLWTSTNKTWSSELCLSTPMKSVSSHWNALLGKPIILVDSRTSGSSRTLASVSIPFRSQVLGVWEMQILLFQTLLKGHEKKVGLDDESVQCPSQAFCARHCALCRAPEIQKGPGHTPVPKELIVYL